MQLSNRLTRILVALIAIPLIVGVAYFGKLLFLIFILFIGLLAYDEFSKMLKSKSIYSNYILGLLSVFFIIVNSYLNLISFEAVAIIIVLFILIAELFRNKASAIMNIGGTLTGIFYIGLFAASIIRLREFPFTENNYEQGGLLIISILASIWICDSAAYFLGTAFGSHKLFPRVSPNKSWEGAISGFIFAILTMILAKVLVIDYLSYIDVLIIGFIIGTVGQIGDLVESLIKRDANVKDSSSVIPGHGGIFDRFDSFLFSSPVIYLYLVLFK